MRKILILTLLVVFYAQASSIAAYKEVTAPKRIERDGQQLLYNPSWKDKEIYIETNLDDDPENEIIIGFVAGYKEEIEPQKEDDIERTYFQKQKEIPLIQNFAFYQIYDKMPGGYFKNIKTINGMDRLGKIEIVKLNEEDPPAIFILSPGGENYLDLSVYQWRNGGYTLIFNKGSSNGVGYGKNDTSFSIVIGNKETKQDTYIWNTQKKVWQAQDNKL